jgi:phosphoenolpyruvate synthase/pyruvate phosphate dikinase
VTMALARVRALADLRQVDAAAFGGKSAALGELIAAGVAVPGGFAVGTSAFAEHVERAGLAGRIAALLAALDPGDVAAVQRASGEIGGALRAAPVPASVRAEIERGYGALGAGDPPVAVRSSALGEDSADAAFAGQQETFLWVRGAEQVADAVRACWASLYSPTAISYRARLGDAAAVVPAMGVAVQAMVDAAVSGVMFTCNPVTGDPSVVAVNASWGLGLGVVGGEVTPDDFLVSKVTREVLRRTVNRKGVEYRPDAAAGGAVAVDVPEDRACAPCLGDEHLAPLTALARDVERHFGCRQDIEWAIARTGTFPENLFVLQSRPVTTAPAPPAPPSATSALGLVMGTFGVPPEGG